MTGISTQDRGQWPSASAAEANSLCPGRHLAQLGLPEGERDKDAERGQAIHAAWAGNEYRQLTPDETQTLFHLEDREMAIFNQWIGQCGGSPIGGQKPEILVEKRLWHKWASNGQEFRCSGQADRLYLYKHKALIIDGKTGRKAVTPEPSNLQLRWLAALVAVYYPIIDEVTVALAQHWSPKSPPCVYDLAALAKSLVDMEWQVEACYSLNAKRIPGPVQCEYCRAKGTCPEFAASGLPVAFSKPPPPAELVKEAIAALPGHRLGAFLSMVRMAEGVADSEVRKRLGAGEAVDGWQLLPGRTREFITDPQELFNRFVLEGGTTEQFLPTVAVGKGKFKEAVATVTGMKGKRLEQKLETMLAGVTETKTGAAVLEKG